VLSGRISGGFTPLLDALQLLAILLRIAYDLALLQAGHPQVAGNTAALPASADRSAVLKIGRMLLGGLLLPTASRADVEHANVAVWQQSKRSVNFVHAVELRRAVGAETFKPCRVNEIGHQNIVDRIAQAVVFARVADFIGVESAGGIAVLHEHGEIDVRVAEHLQQFVAGGDRPRSAGFQVAGGEDLANRQTLGGKVVVAESVGLVGVVEQYQPPTSRRRL
jgi:hypothetical protein